MKRSLLPSLVVIGLLGGPIVLPASAHAQETVGRYIDDATITARIKAKFVEDSKVNALRINVQTKNGVVQLSGFAANEDEKARAAEIARSVPEVRDVDNAVILRKGDDTPRDSQRDSAGRDSSREPDGRPMERNR